MLKLKHVINSIYNTYICINIKKKFKYEKLGFTFMENNISI